MHKFKPHDNTLKRCDNIFLRYHATAFFYFQSYLPFLHTEKKENMADLTSKQKKEWAAMLYLKENLTQQEIADKVGTTRVTINKWIKDEKWAERKAGFTITREEQIKHLYRQIAEINDVIVGRENGKRFATPTEADTLSKLSSAIKKMETETGIAEIVSVGTRFLEFLRSIDLDKAKEFTQFFDIFIKQNL